MNGHFMEWLRRLVRRTGMLVRRDSVERAMDAELRYHLECEAAERIRRGQCPEEARRAARLDFGGLESIKEQARDVRGIRVIEDALGAPGSHVVLLVLGQAMRRATVGMVVGSVAALSLARTMKALLFGVRPADPFSFAVVAAVLLVVVLAATLIPAMKALRISPLSTLRLD